MMRSSPAPPNAAAITGNARPTPANNSTFASSGLATTPAAAGRTHRSSMSARAASMHAAAAPGPTTKNAHETMTRTDVGALA
jgi:hypothetical protein